MRRRFELRGEFLVLGHRINRSAWLRGSIFSLLVVVGVGLVIGNLVDQKSDNSTLVTAAISLGLVIGGFIASWYASRSNIVHGMLTSCPAILLSFIFQCIRMIRGVRSVSWLSLLMASFLSISLATLGGVLAGRWSPNRGSLFE